MLGCVGLSGCARVCVCVMRSLVVQFFVLLLEVVILARVVGCVKVGKLMVVGWLSCRQVCD